MMCDPCFMDANQVGFVHELTWDEIKTMLDNAITIKPRRQMSVQFSGGEPTLSPYFLDAVAYARKVGYTACRLRPTASSSPRAPSSPSRRRKPVCAMPTCSSTVSATLQLAPSGRQSVRCEDSGDREPAQRRCRNRSGRDHRQRPEQRAGRPLIQFALDNPKRISFLSFQPVSFTGRDEAITDERRAAQRYTLSHLAHDVKKQTGLGEPTRDWFPISFMSTFSDWADLVHGPDKDWGSLSCGCHPNCGVAWPS